jgi:hypothetical protein
VVGQGAMRGIILTFGVKKAPWAASLGLALPDRGRRPLAA